MSLIFNDRLCTGCRICELICSASHTGEFIPSRARIRVTIHTQSGEAYARACVSCPAAPCISSCPQEAITRSGIAAPLDIDSERCNGCRACIRACPSESLYFDAAAGHPLACDLCGGEPQCVAYCHLHALTLNAA